jgi:IS605 OrfB family transposase
MKTIKLPISVSPEDAVLIKDFQRQQDIVYRSMYNRFKEGKTDKEAEAYIATLNNIDNMDSWFVRCAREAAKDTIKGEAELNKQRKGKKDKNGNEIKPIETSIFGSKADFRRRLKGKITNEEWKALRLSPLYVIGEANYHGNRKFNLNILNGKIIFKPYFGKKITIDLPRIKPNLLDDLLTITGSYTIELSTTQIWITFQERQKSERTTISNRVMGIDLNPYSIGFTISDIVDGEKQEPIFKRTYSFSQIKDSNKMTHEVIQVCHQMIRIAKYYRCSQIGMEELSMDAEDKGKSRWFNKAVNNIWQRNLATNKMKMLAHEHGIEFKLVNPAYSSFIGNMIYDYTDQENASLEIARRAHFKFQKGKFYPSLSLVKHLWKKHVDGNQEWKDLAAVINTLKFRYRVPLGVPLGHGGFSASSKIIIY